MPPFQSPSDTWYAPLLEKWEQLPAGVRVASAIAAGVLVIALLVLGYRRVPRGRRLIASTIFFGLLTAGLSTWSFLLPRTRGLFVLEHQIVRVSAALSATLLVSGLLALAVPKVLNFFEGSRFVTYVAARHVRSEKSGFLTVISFLSIAGVGVSSFALCAVISIMGGFGADLKAKILDNNAHIRVEAENSGGIDFWRDTLDQVRLVRGVHAATPVASGEVMASSSTNTAGVLLKGVDTETIGQVVDVPQHVVVGNFEYLDDPVALKNLPEDAPIGIGPGGELFLKGPEPKSTREGEDPNADVYPGAVLGKELAKNLHVYVGDVVTFVSPLGDLGPMGVMPRTRKFRVAGIFDSGMYEYDASHAYVKIEEAQRFLDLGHLVTALEVRVKDVERVEEVTPAVREALERDDLRVRDWKELNRNLFGALQLEKVMTFVILSIAIAVASFCIICTLLLMVTEKSKEIAILKAMGTSDRTILKVFMAEGMFIGGVGTVFGVVTGFIAMQGLKTFGVRLDPEVYYITNLPVTVEPLDYLLVAICAFAITTLATVYPASAASALRPVDGIRYE